MSERTKEELMEQAVYAVAAVVGHYGPRFNENGIKWLRRVLDPLDKSYSLHTDASYRVDVYPGDQYEDFHQRVIQPNGWYPELTIEEIRAILREDNSDEAL